MPIENEKDSYIFWRPQAGKGSQITEEDQE
jgi:hypothetical protein